MNGHGNRRIGGAILAMLAGLVLPLLLPGAVAAHPLGNFTINHFSRIEAKRDRIRLRYVIDMAEISTLQELQAANITDTTAPSAAELDAYLAEVASRYTQNLLLGLDGSRLDLDCTAKTISMPDGAGGLKTLRTELDYEAKLPNSLGPQPHSITFDDLNHDKRIGWREIVVVADPGLSIFNSTAFGTPVTDELKAYPQDALAAPLDERKAEFGIVSGPAPTGSRSLQARDGARIIQTRDRLAELIAAPKITPLAALLGLLIATVLGSMHAMSPGHGKTVVGAYLVGSRGTAKHAAFLGLTVTITHTAGVFALGVVTLLASKYVLPEKLFPILSFLSGALVLGIGLSLFVRRGRAVLAQRRIGISESLHGGHSHSDHEHDHSHDRHHSDHKHDAHLDEHHQSHEHGHSHMRNDIGDHSQGGHSHGGGELENHHDAHVGSHSHSHFNATHTHSHSHANDTSHASDSHGHHDHGHHEHSHHDHGQRDHHHEHVHSEDGHTHGVADTHVHYHGGRPHSHLPPGADGQPVGWKSLLALGISGGLLPCPSALVVLLAAISLHRVGYGLLLVLAFSAGLAGSLTAVGLLFVYAGRLMKAKSAGKMATLGRIVPVFSSLVITLAGSAICIEALGQAGIHLDSLVTGMSSGFRPAPAIAWLASVAVVGAVLSGGVYWFKSYQRRRHEC